MGPRRARLAERLVAQWNGTNVKAFQANWSVAGYLGAHNLTVESGSGRAASLKSLDFRILERPTAGAAANFTGYQVLSDSAGAATLHPYSVRHEAGCGPAFTLDVDGPPGTDFNLYLNETTPTDPSSPAQYTYAETSTSRSERIHYRAPVPGWAYSILVEQASGPPATYSLRYTTFAAAGSACEDGVASEPVPESRVTDDPPEIDDVEIGP